MLFSYYTSTGNESSTKTVDLSKYRFLTITFKYGDIYYDVKTIPVNFFKQHCTDSSHAINLHAWSSSGNPVANVWYYNNQIGTFINIAYHVIEVWGSY